MLSKDFTPVYRHQKRYHTKQFTILLSALGAGLIVFAVFVVFNVVAIAIIGPRAAWGFVIAVAAAATTYGVWGYARPGYMKVSDWIEGCVDYYLRQPRRFVGLSHDVEPVHLHWTAIVYEVRGRAC